jgi:asparagine synthase (glutamine-hydrolysing)
LPPSLVARRKQGFDVPVSDWLRGALREPLGDYLAEETVRRRGLFRPAAVSTMMREHLSGRADHGERLWLLMALEGWSRVALDRAPGGTS